jgi:hypothetical protein
MLSGQIKEGDTAFVDVDDKGGVKVVKSEEKQLLVSVAG